MESPELLFQVEGPELFLVESIVRGTISGTEGADIQPPLWCRRDVEVSTSVRDECEFDQSLNVIDLKLTSRQTVGNKGRSTECTASVGFGSGFVG